VTKTKPATFTRCKTAQTGLTSTTSHRGSLRILSLIEQQYLIRRAANQLEWPSTNGHCSTNWTTSFTFYFTAVSSHFITINNENWLPTIWSDSGGEVKSLGGDVSVSARKDVYANVCLILNSYRDWAISHSKPNSRRFLYVDLGASRSL
jgi:hypothetical protein